MPQVIEQQGSPIGRLGKGIGKGLSDQIPKEIDRYRLTSGLDKFAKESSGKSPFQQAVDFYKIPGATAEMGYTLFPLLQQEAKRNAAAGLAEKGETSHKSGKTNAVVTGIEDTEGNIKPYMRKGKNKFSEENKGLKPLEATKAQITPIERLSGSEKYGLAAEMSRDNPQLWPTPEDALPIIESDEATRIANRQELRSTGDVADALQQRVKNNLEGAWIKDKTVGEIPGTVQSRIFDNIENQLADPKNKKSEAELTKEGRKLGESIAKAHTNLKSASKEWFVTPKSIRKTVAEIREPFEKAGALEEFADLASANFGWSPQIAASHAEPLNKSQMNFFKEHVKEPKRSALASTFVDAYEPGDVKKKSIILADDIADFIDEDTNILSLVAEAQRKHLDPNILLDRLKINRDSGLWKPSEKQQRQLQKIIPTVPSIGDFYISLFLDDDAMVE